MPGPIPSRSLLPFYSLARLKVPPSHRHRPSFSLRSSSTTFRGSCLLPLSRQIPSHPSRALFTLPPRSTSDGRMFECQPFQRDGRSTSRAFWPARSGRGDEGGSSLSDEGGTLSRSWVPALSLICARKAPITRPLPPFLSEPSCACSSFLAEMGKGRMANNYSSSVPSKYPASALFHPTLLQKAAF